MEPKTEKRIVSKGEYARLRGQQEVFRWGSVAMAVVVAVLVLCTVGFIIVAASTGAALCYALALLCFAAAWLTKRIAEAIMDKALLKLNAVPLTRANAADLPAPDSLVRASLEPLQAQEGVLLRAAAQGQATPQEQLVRASVGVNREENAL